MSLSKPRPHLQEVSKKELDGAMFVVTSLLNQVNKDTKPMSAADIFSFDWFKDIDSGEARGWTHIT
jgi:hypothetical protein